jgi:hypothetical protein
MCVRQGRAHPRLRARDRAAPAERDGAIAHENGASVFLHTAPVRRRPRRTHAAGGARPARAAEGRRTVALVSEIATPSNTSSPLKMITAPPSACTCADAERSGAHPSHRAACTAARSDASCAAQRTRHARACAACGCRVRGSMCVVQRLLFTLLQFVKTYQLTYTAILRLFDHIRLRCCCLQGTASSASASTGASTAK